MFTELCNYHRYIIPDHLHPSKEKPNPLVVTLPCLLPQRQMGRRKCNPFQYSYLENSLDREAWLATVHGVAKNRTQLGEHSLFSSLKPLATTHLLCMELPILDILHKWNPATCDLL